MVVIPEKIELISREQKLSQASFPPKKKGFMVSILYWGGRGRNLCL